MLFPLVAELPKLKLFAFDFSANAIKLLEERAAELGVSYFCQFFELLNKSFQLSVATSVVDLSIPSISAPFKEQVDLATLIFVLSAIHPDKQKIAAENMKNLVKVGGTVVVRDYGLNDHAMIRFGRDARLGDRFYVRQDGTRAYYFDLNELAEIFESVGFKCVSKEYLHRITINHKKGLKVPRIFVQGRFVREH